MFRRCTIARRIGLLCAVVAGAVFSTVAGQAVADEADEVYEEFNQFCIKNFGAEKEPLVYEKFGKELQFVDQKKDTWQHVSENSACFAFETNLPAKTYVEYGETPRYGEKTPLPERHFYLHLHYLKNLETGKTYHYRFVALDERGNRIMTGDATFETKRIAGAVYIPGELGEAPYKLDKPNTTYVLKEDITAASQGFLITASGVALDLNGHTLVYDEEKPPPYAGKRKSWMRFAYDNTAPAGVRVSGRRVQGVKVLNGTIRQGKHNGSGDRKSLGCAIKGFGFNPVFISSAGTEVAGVTAEYAGKDIMGILAHYARGADVHHNVVTDKGTHITDRHQGLQTISGVSKPHHNLVKRARHRTMGGTGVYGNEIYLDTWATNAGGPSIGRGGAASSCYNNRIFGRGYHAIGIGVYSNAKNVKVSSNFIHLVSTEACKTRWPEYGKMSTMVGIRLTPWASPMDDIEIAGNTVVLYGKGGTGTRGFWPYTTSRIRNCRFNNNLIKIIDEASTGQHSAVHVSGAVKASHGPAYEGGTDPVITCRNNTFISNVCHIRFGGGSYCWGSNVHFYDCRFVKVGNNRRYRTFVLPPRRYTIKNHVIRDATFEGGASFDSVDDGRYKDPEKEHSYTVQWTVTVKTVPGATVTVKDKTGKKVFSGTADETGVVVVPLSQYLHDAEKGDTFFTPHTITVEKDGRRNTKKLTVDRKQIVQVGL